MAVLALGIHGLDGRLEDHIRAILFEEPQVVLQCARITREVLIGAELGGIDENRHDANVAGLATGPHERQVSGVQVGPVVGTRPITLVPARGERRAQFADVTNDMQSLGPR